MRVAIVYPRAILDTVPSLVGAAELMAERGWDVDVFTYTAAGQPAARFTSPHVTLRSLGVEGLADQSTARIRGAVRKAGWLPQPARVGLARGYAAMGAGLTHGSRLIARVRARPADYDCVIGVDPDGLELAASMAHGAPLGYYSLELLLSDELTTPTEQQLFIRARELMQQAAFVIVQDEARAELLVRDNTLDPRRVILVPNAPLGPARRRPSRMWHDRFGLRREQRVVLHSGSLGDWTGIEDVVDSVPTWPEPWVLVVHTRYDGESSPYIERLRARADQRRVLFSLKPVERQAYDELIDAADIGIAFYVPNDDSAYTQRNIQTIGLSSGKLAYYLRAGLPVIVNRASSIADTIEATGCGVAVDDAAHVGQALTRIQRDAAEMTRAALAFFDERLDFRRAFDAVLERMAVPA